MEMRGIIDDPMGTFEPGFDYGDRLQLISGHGGINSDTHMVGTWMSKLQHQRHFSWGDEDDHESSLKYIVIKEIRDALSSPSPNILHLCAVLLV